MKLWESMETCQSLRLLPLCELYAVQHVLNMSPTVPLPQGGLMSLKQAPAVARSSSIRFAVRLGPDYLLSVDHLDLDFTPFATLDLVSH